MGPARDQQLAIKEKSPTRFINLGIYGVIDACMELARIASIVTFRTNKRYHVS